MQSYGCLKEISHFKKSLTVHIPMRSEFGNQDSDFPAHTYKLTFGNDGVPIKFHGDG